MNKNNILRTITFAIIFAVSFLGINIAQNKTGALTERASDRTLISLGTQSMAYCNVAEYEGERWDGHCTGRFGNDPDDRCLSPSMNQSTDCTKQ